MNNTNKHSLLLVAALLIAGLLSSCLKENFDDCPRPFQVTIKALDADEKDITESGAVQQVILFVFDENQQIVDAFELTADQVKNRQPIGITQVYPGAKNLTFSAWGNLDDKVDFSQKSSVKQIEDLYVKLKKQGDNAQSPGDIFHGALQVPVEFGGLELGKSHEVTITRKTVGVTITAIDVKRWNGNKDGVYTYRLRETLDTYDKDCVLSGNVVSYFPSVTLSDDDHLVTPLFYTFPAATGKNFEVDILCDGEVIFTAVKNNDGTPLTPLLGKTLNILIVFTGDISVQSIVTPWNVVYQYVEI